jgi:hypothetical protein
VSRLRSSQEALLFANFGIKRDTSGDIDKATSVGCSEPFETTPAGLKPQQRTVKCHFDESYDLPTHLGGSGQPRVEPDALELSEGSRSLPRSSRLS